jgi:hypothetical protein
MSTKLQSDCRHSLLNIFINLEQSNSGLQRYSAAVKTWMMKFAAEDLLWMILMEKNFGYLQQISVWINAFNSWETICCSFDSVLVFSWIYLVQIVPFAFGSAFVDRWFTEKRKEYARAMLPFLHASKRNGWHHFVTGDESWLLFSILSRRMWTLSRDDVVTKWGLDIQSKNWFF